MGKRRSIDVPGLKHVHPIPNACRLGPFLVTGGIYGKDPATGELAPDIAGQCALMFVNLKRVLEAGGATPEDIIKMTVWIKDRNDRSYVNKEWVEMFPDAGSRPVRHTFKDEEQPYGALVSCEVMAVVGAS
jgi:enamine deaminase RidA (YjgF/YER057c/UK114 family)